MKSILMCLGVVALLGGCDSSKQELDSTKSTLATVMQQRDDLKTENKKLQDDLTATKAQLAKATTPAPAAAQAAAKTPAPADAKHPAAAVNKKHKS